MKLSNDRVPIELPVLLEQVPLGLRCWVLPARAEDLHYRSKNHYSKDAKNSQQGCTIYIAGASTFKVKAAKYYQRGHKIYIILESTIIAKTVEYYQLE